MFQDRLSDLQIDYMGTLVSMGQNVSLQAPSLLQTTKCRLEKQYTSKVCMYITCIILLLLTITRSLQ